MFKKILLFVSLITTLFASNETSYPSTWKDFEKVRTPLSIMGVIPECSKDVSSLPPIYQETVATYCGVKPGGPGAVEILINAKAKESFATRNGTHPDDAVMILHLIELKLLFVTTYKNNKPFYSIYTEDGHDASASTGSGLNPNDCRSCHTGYGAFCVNGQCASLE